MLVWTTMSRRRSGLAHLLDNVLDRTVSAQAEEQYATENQEQRWPLRALEKAVRRSFVQLHMQKSWPDKTHEGPCRGSHKLED